MNLQFSALSQNESFARVTVASFITQLDPTMDELTEIKTVVSEAVTNAIIHGYESNPDGVVYISVTLHEDGVVELMIRDEGIGIDNVDEAKRTFIHNETRSRTFWNGFHHNGKLYGRNSSGVYCIRRYDLIFKKALNK